MKDFAFVNKKEFAIVSNTEFEEAKKGLEELKTIANYTRPQDLSGLTPNLTLAEFSNLISPIDLYQMAKLSDILRNVIPTIRNEIFRNGFDVQADDIAVSSKQDDKIWALIERANHNEQTLKEVLMEFEDDLQIYDNAYLLAIKSYFINEDLDIIGGEIDEIIRVDPLITEKVLDQKARLGYDQQGRQLYFSLKNRSQILYTPRDADGRQCLRACFKVRTGDKDGDVAYYDPAEMIHVSKYNPSKTYGFSQLYSLYNKVMTLINQDTYIRNYYSGDKVPKGILVANTSNATSFQAMWSQFLAKIRKNPHQINPVINQTNDPSKSTLQFISFMNNLTDMQYTEGRNEMRQVIGSLFNVSPVFQNDTSQGGGLNNEGLQITVTNRGVEIGQSIYNEKVLNWIFKRNMGITDYTVTLKPSDEMDEAAEKDLRLKEIAIAKATAELGIKVSMEKDGSFAYEAGDVKLQAPAQEPFIPYAASEKSDVEEVQKPFADYKDFDDCVKQNSDKEDPQAYCAVIMRKVEKKSRAITVDGYLSPEPGPDLSDHEVQILGSAYAACRKDGGDKEKCSKIAWGAVHNAKKSDLKKAEVPKLPKKEQKLFQSALEKELDDIVSKLDFSRKPSESELNNIIEKLTKNLNKRLNAKSANFIKAIYDKAKGLVEKEIDMKFPMTDKDKNIIEALKRDPTYRKSFDGISSSMSKNLTAIVKQAYDDPKNFTIDKIVDKMKQELDGATGNLRTIARTETSKVSIAARKATYDKTGFEYKYRVIGPDDFRTGEDSKEIVAATKKGVSWDDMVSIIQGVADKYSKGKWKVNPDAPIPRPNWRHVPVAERVK